MQDVNPLYGRERLRGCSRAGSVRAATALYNLADFMLGLRSQYALSNVLIANLRQQMHFAFVQDDFRVNDKLTLNLGLRYEYATPHWERDNILSNYDPATARWCRPGMGRSGQARSTRIATTSARASGSRGPCSPRTVVRGGYGISYVHFHRAGGANILAINGPQVMNGVATQADPTRHLSAPRSRAILRGSRIPSGFNPLRANITYMPEDYQSSRVQSYFISVQREIARNMIVDLAYVGNRADGLLLMANFNQAARTTPPAPSAAGAPADPRSLPTSPTLQRRQVALQQPAGEIRVPPAPGPDAAQRVHLVEGQGQRRRLARGTGGNFPAPQDFYNLDADYGTSAYDRPQQHHQLRLGAAVRPRPPLAERTRARSRPCGGWTLSGINTMASGELGDAAVHAPRRVRVSGIQQDFRGANNYRPNVNGSPYGDRNSVTNYLSRDTVTAPTDPSQPFGNAARNSVRGPWFWQMDLVAAKDFRLPIGRRACQFGLEAFNVLNKANFRAPSNRSAGSYGTITSTYDARQLQLGSR